MKDNRKRFKVKVWVTKTKVTDGVKQSYLHWNHERLNYTENAVASEIEVDHKTNLLQFS